MITKKTTILLTFSIILVLVSSLAFGYVLYRTYHFMSEIAMLTEETGRSAKTVANISGLNRSVITTKKLRRALQDIFVQPKDISSTLQDIEALAEAKNISLTVRTVTETEYSESSEKKKRRKKKKDKKKSPVALIAVSVKMYGTFDSIITFLKIIEQMPKALKIEKLHIVESKEKTNRWEGECSIVFLSASMDIL